jgi:hypothetical protein
MRHPIHALVLVLAGLVVAGLLPSAGCQPAERRVESTYRYDPPGGHEVAGSAVVDAGVDETWTRLRRRASESPFRLLASEPRARFAVIELEAGSAGRSARELVDCGRVVRVVAEDGETRRFDYAVAESGPDREVEVAEDHYRIRELEREVTLETRTTLFLRPEGSARTRVTANTRYRLVIETSGRSLVLPRRRSTEPPPAEPFGPERVEIAFTSFEAGPHPDDERILCRSTGEVERLLLALADAGPGDA